MLKISAGKSEEGEAVLHLEGQVIGPWVGELDRVCDPILAGGARLSLDLSAVSFVGREGVELFRRLRERDARLLNCSRFVTEQLKGSPGNGSVPSTGAEAER